MGAGWREREEDEGEVDIGRMRGRFLSHMSLKNAAILWLDCQALADL
jgi:hypothetical protein